MIDQLSHLSVGLQLAGQVEPVPVEVVEVVGKGVGKLLEEGEEDVKTMDYSRPWNC